MCEAFCILITSITLAKKDIIQCFSSLFPHFVGWIIFCRSSKNHYKLFTRKKSVPVKKYNITKLVAKLK